jgi:KaiC/GvpD/RAD55 family RecA-like ATPase
VTPVASSGTLLFKKRNNDVRWDESELDRVSSGVDGLDSLIQGGFAVGSSTLLYGPPGNGKRPFCLQFLAEGLRLGDSGVMVVSNESVQDAIESFQDLGCGLGGSAAVGRYDFKFVDCYSWRIEEVPYPTMSGDVVKSSMDINHVSLAVAKAIEELKPNKNVRVTLDLLSPLLMTASPQSVYKLGELLTAELKRKGATSMFLLTEGMHDQQTVASLQQLLDNVILFRTADKAGVLRKEVCVAKMKRASFEPRWLTVSKDLKTGKLSIRQE